MGCFYENFELIWAQLRSLGRLGVGYFTVCCVLFVIAIVGGSLGGVTDIRLGGE